MEAITDLKGIDTWTQSDRLLRIATPLGSDKLLVESFKGIDDLSHGFTYEIIVLSTDAYIPLKSLLGQPVLLEMLTAHSRTELRPFHGHVMHFQNLGANGGFARYRLIVEPWTAYLGFRVDSTTYQDMTVMDIIDSVLSDYQSGGSLQSGTLNPQWRYDIADASVYAKRSLTTQYQESDLAFVQRLMHEEGLFTWIEHEGDTDSPTFGSHTLVIADHNDAFMSNEQADIRYTQASATMKEDSLDRWRHEIDWQPTSVAINSWDYRQINSRPVSAIATPADPQSNATTLAMQETPVAYDYETSDHGQRIAERQLEALVAHSQRYIGAGTVRTLSAGSTFILHDHATDMSDTPLLITRVVHQAFNNLNADLQSNIAQRLGLQAQHNDADGIDSNIHRSVYQPQHVAKLRSTLTAEQQSGTRPLYRNRIEVMPQSIAYRNRRTDEQGNIISPKPTVQGQQTAIVVGPAGQVIYTDRDHRVKVQFHWQRGEQSHSRLQHPSTDGHTGAPSNEQAGTWVRVMTNLAPVAGENWGSVHIPRIGQEVLIDFIEGDIDRPIIIGALYNGQGADNAQYNSRSQGSGSATGNASAWFPGDQGAHAHADVLSGIKTQSMSTSQQGSGSYNQLVFDDTPNESRTSLQQYSTFNSISQLNLGFLRHQTDNQRLNPTGYGTELSTHHNLAIRAGQGMLISTDKRYNATSSQLDSREAQNQIEQSHELQVQMASTAQQHNAKLKAEPAPDKLSAIAAHDHTLEVITATGQGMSGNAEEGGGAGTVTAYSEPNIQFSSPAGITASTPQNAVFSAGNTSSITAGQDINLATQGNQHHLVKDGISLFTYGKADPTGSARLPNKPNKETGIKLHAASGKVSLQSQTGNTHIEADQNLTVNSISKDINIGSPKHILMTAMGAALNIEGGNITLNTSGTISFKAAMKSLTTPKSSSTSSSLPKPSEIKGCAQQQVKGDAAITEF